MFTQAKKANVDMVALREVMGAKKEQLVAQYKRGGIPTPLVRAMGKPKVKRARPIA